MHQPPEQHQDQQPAYQPCPGRILVVEDDRDLCGLLSTLLDVEGYKTATACDGSDAVERVVSERPDAIVLDVMLPNRSGFEICRDLKFRRDTNLIPIVMLTAMHSEDWASMCDARRASSSVGTGGDAAACSDRLSA